MSVAALSGGTWTAVSAPAADTCKATAPPAPTGVTASCQAGVLTVTWNSAGQGPRKATYYKPRVFTGNAMTADTRWTANAAGTATILAPGEPKLPESGTFQVKENL